MKPAALAAQDDLEKECARRATAQSELKSLYVRIFQGPTPSFPEEDEAERKVSSAHEAYSSACARLEVDRQVQRILEDVDRRLRVSLGHIESALDASRLDMFGASSKADMMERSALHDAELEVMQAQMLIMQAQRFSPEVMPLPSVKIARGSLMSDVLFDNIFSDMEFHDKIKNSRAELTRAYQTWKPQVEAAKERCRASEQQAKVQSELPKTAREELQRVRQRIFERMANGEVAAGEAPQALSGKQPDEGNAPPPYS
jgi:hypothetical protein